MVQTEYSAHPIARLGFGEGGPAPVLLGGRKFRIGSAADNDLVLDDEGVAAHHLILVSRYRCWMLLVEPGAERVHVNARPVRELALLRPGDCISVGGRKLHLLPAESSHSHEGDAGTARQHSSAPTATGLRCVAGPLSGRFLPISSDLLLDRHLLPGVAGCLRLRADDSGATFERIDSDGPSPACNGVPMCRGRLVNDDQLIWGRHRFVLEARTGVAGTACIPLHSETNSEPEQPEAEPAQREVVWLLAVAALMAALIALLLLMRA